MNQPLAARYSQQDLVDIQLGRLMRKIGTNPKTRRAVTNAIKEVSPGAHFPDQAINDLRDEFNATREKDKMDAETQRITARLEAQKLKLREKFSDDQIKEIEERVMPKYGLADYEAAAIIYGADLKPTDATSRGGRERMIHGTTWEFPELPKLFENPTLAAREEAARVIDEFRAARR